MTKKQQLNARIMWLALLLVLIAGNFYADPAVILPSALVGWCGGIMSVFAWFAKPNE